MGLVKQWLLAEHFKFETPSAPLNPRLPIPDATRRAVLERAHYACEDCLWDLPVELHHLHYNTQGDETPDDLVALCRGCHEKRHRDPFDEFWTDPVAMRHHWGGDPPWDLDDIPGWRD